MDVSKDGTLVLEDLVRIFARIDGITPDKARNMAHATFDNIVHSSKARLLTLVLHTCCCYICCYCLCYCC